MQRLVLLLSVVTAVGLTGVAAAADEPAELRRLAGRRLTLVTDVEPGAEVDALPGVFDQAFDQWCAYFGIDAAQSASWHVRGYLMRSPERFRAAGLLPAELPEFPNAFSRGDEFWMHEQASDYYRRHLMLHEGTHCFMNSLVGGTGPPWFAEGLAELLATHRLDGGKLSLAWFPKSAAEVPKWGRIEIVNHDYAQRKARSLARLFALEGTLHGGNEAYGWCWAVAAFFDGHPSYRERFRQLPASVERTDFAEQVGRLFASDADRLREDWQLFVANLDYGYDFERMEVDRAPGQPLAAPGHSATVRADRGWQSTGVALVPGETYRLRASGRYQLARDGERWASEPGGVTLDYHRGQPVGVLLAAVRSDDPSANNPSGLIKPLVVGLGRALEVERPGTLYLRINDSPGRLAGNSGSAQVEIARGDPLKPRGD